MWFGSTTSRKRCEAVHRLVRCIHTNIPRGILSAHGTVATKISPAKVVEILFYSLVKSWTVERSTEWKVSGNMQMALNIFDVLPINNRSISWRLRTRSKHGINIALLTVWISRYFAGENSFVFLQRLDCVRA